MEKYGFVYIWFDRKHKRYYIGCHWGSVDDGYICSSSNMKSAYKRRPLDFVRKILKINIESKKTLLEEEYKWLAMIKNEELGEKYYNLHNHHFNHWSSNEASKLSIGEKISASPNRSKNISKALTGRKLSEETKEKLRQVNLGKTYSSEINAKKGGHRDYTDVEFRNKMTIAARNRSEETRKKISENNKRLQAEGKIGMRGKRHSPETIEKMRQTALKRKLNR
jgi:hypothetical protein